MPVGGGRLQAVLDGYANFLQEKHLALPKQQAYLVGWERELKTKPRSPLDALSGGESRRGMAGVDGATAASGGP